MKTVFKSLHSIILPIMLMLLMPLLSGAADTIRVNIPRVTVTMARSYNFTSAANDIYVPVEFNSAMSTDKVEDYIEESNAFLFDHYGDDVVEMSGVSDDLGTIYLDIKPNTGITRVLLITSSSSGSKVITVVQAGDTPEPEPEPEPEPDEKFNIPGNWKMVRHYTDETGNNYITDITFYDGLGYSSQIVNVGASPTGNRNIVTPIVYDRMRRSDSVLFLPYASATVNTIKEESAPLQGQSSFYGSLFGTGESGHAKTRRVYEPSELNRVSREHKPGSAYTSKYVSYSYETNSANEVFNLRVNGSTGTMHTDSSYPYYDAGTLFKDVATDEDGNTFTTYKDVAGRLIMEKRGTDSKTYYAYDDRGFLSWVITPAGSALLSSSSNWSKTSTNAVNYCYVYSHDYRGNITEKSIPGAGTSEYVYDKGGRLVLERDANLKGKNRWIYHVYDNIGREIECNLVQGTASVTRVSAQTNYNNLSINNSYPQLGGGTPETPPSVVGNFTLVCKLSQTRFGGGVYRTTSSTQTSSFTVPSYLAFSPVSGVAESADLDNVKVIGYKLYEKIALLDGSENGNAGSGNTSYIERAFHYDRKGRVMQVVEKTGATAADGAVKAEYLYSADGIKQRVVDGAGSNGYLYLGTLVLSKSGESYTLSSTGFGGGRIIGGANNSCLAYYYGTDHLGSVRVITDGSGSVVERNDYYPMGMRTATGNSYPQLTANLYKYNGKEVQTIGNLGFTDYGARMYDDFTGRWFVPDPLAEKYASMSPYMYCGGNPINAIDVDGRSTWVVRAGKGKYEVVGGNLYDNDRNIYVGTLDKKNNKFTREYSIGITTSITSFYYCDAKEGPKWSKESIIDVNDRSGYEFLKKIMSQIPPMIDDYMLNARTGHRYDFKVTNGTDHEIEGIDIYRGMPVGVTDKGQVIFSSARDIGNIAAGFIAGVNGMPWIPSRLAFDFYQGGIEGISTRNAEFYGWQLGYYNTSATQKRDNLMNSLGSAVMSLFKSFKNKKK